MPKNLRSSTPRMKTANVCLRIRYDDRILGPPHTWDWESKIKMKGISLIEADEC